MLSPVLFIVHTTTLITYLIEKHYVNHAMFADDAHFGNSALPEHVDRLVQTLHDVETRMSHNKLKLNRDKH